MSFFNYTLVFFFLLWLIFTFINQFENKLRKRVKSFDIFNLIPKWTFFAPNPSTTDLHLFYREIDHANNKSAFVEYPLTQRQGFKHIFFNPEKRSKKALMDLIRGLSRCCEKGILTEKNIQLSFYYIALLNFLSSIKTTQHTVQVQFLIIRSVGLADIESIQIVLTSDFHAV